ncbi:competence type IV pilus ATPase ComGA [Bombilactobacillus thymidiniphilus]|uniref:Flp pilus assembly complex ATPase component TadA n=1 Tax=Bombilactobacillus thymidiniphilus TaxID=2923363 RepID=A0ABY4PE57_9LACO|nr:competence type IV pilus ATPase ComGA [Bombilactobacillus thymidiniphilus]UQS83806.1 Flp pilus assembly complex ATPase component TadA [Bombilactobacillus thymidiniphilus]
MPPEIYTQQLLQFACQREVSDIFFLPKGTETIIKMREMDGLHDYQILDFAFAQGVVNYLKFTADMNISEHRRPQVGARSFYQQQQTVNLRLSSVGDFSNQESLVIRLIYPLKQNAQAEQLEHVATQIMQQTGLILFSGPTGSGKTTSMYYLAKKYAQNKFVLAVEDPVEVIEPDFLQVQVNKRAQMGYADLIRTSLRHRPDILILGEIRDEETARMALRAALSGHLVISTVHSRNKYAVVGRMMELGINQSELESILTCIIYQRLLPQQNNTVKTYQDLLVGEDLRNAIHIPQSNNEDWQLLLQNDLRKGLIDEETYRLYKAG